MTPERGHRPAAAETPPERTNRPQIGRRSESAPARTARRTWIREHLSDLAADRAGRPNQGSRACGWPDSRRPALSPSTRSPAPKADHPARRWRIRATPGCTHMAEERSERGRCPPGPCPLRRRRQASGPRDGRTGHGTPSAGPAVAAPTQGRSPRSPRRCPDRLALPEVADQAASGNRTRPVDAVLPAVHCKSAI